MKLTILIACGTLAACASNKPPEDASQANSNSTTMTAPPPPPVTSTTYDANASATPTTGLAEPPPGTAASPSGTAAGRDTSAMATPAPVTESTPAPGPVAQGEPDNSRVNKRDRPSTSPPTPMDQGNGEADLKTTQQIRKAVMADSSLSFTAKNVKIITNGGKVTLRGPVKTDAERQAIEASARKVAGENVDDQLEVKK
ncbi:MAG TPA: BON domain-containing protein [Polyangiaceae bacterium]|jgi:hypothetical protein|nr:BON domain-containing protein [Polyangiaceae bacterium]